MERAVLTLLIEYSRWLAAMKTSCTQQTTIPHTHTHTHTHTCNTIPIWTGLDHGKRRVNFPCNSWSTRIPATCGPTTNLTLPTSNGLILPIHTCTHAYRYMYMHKNGKIINWSWEWKAIIKHTVSHHTCIHAYPCTRMYMNVPLYIHVQGVHGIWGDHWLLTLW